MRRDETWQPWFSFLPSCVLSVKETNVLVLSPHCVRAGHFLNLVLYVLPSLMNKMQSWSKIRTTRGCPWDFKPWQRRACFFALRESPVWILPKAGQGQTTPEALAGAGWPGIPWQKWAPNSWCAGWPGTHWCLSRVDSLFQLRLSCVLETIFNFIPNRIVQCCF